MVVQNRLVELNGGAGSPCPITIEFKRLRRSGRLASLTKRPYESIQGANKKSGKLLKKPKLTADESATDEPRYNKPVSEPDIVQWSLWRLREMPYFKKTLTKS